MTLILSLFGDKYGLRGEGNGNPLQYSCLGNPMDGGAWWATVRGVTKGQTQLSNFTFTFMYVYSAVSDSSQPHGL